MDTIVSKQLKIKACKVRMGAIEGVYNAKSGHPGGSLSIADILTYLYFHRLNIDPKNPQWEDRDRLVMSKVMPRPPIIPCLRTEDISPSRSSKHSERAIRDFRVTRT